MQQPFQKFNSRCLLLTFALLASFFYGSLQAQTKPAKPAKQEKEAEPPPPAEPELRSGPAQFPGGLVEMMKYIHSHLVKPDTILKGLSGKVFVYFKVETDGTITNAKVSQHLAGCPQCDDEALKLVKGMPRWQPAVKLHKIDVSDVNLPVNFNPPRENEKH